MAGTGSSPDSRFGRFEIRRRLGEGGMGVVYEAWDPHNQARIALKTLNQKDPGRISLFKHEFRSLARITHPNLVALYDLFAEGEQWFFTMEYVAGLTFLRHVRQFSSPAEPDPETGATLTNLATATMLEGAVGTAEALFRGGFADYPTLTECLRQLAAGLSALHAAGKIHRDIKPGNVLVASGPRLVILDFGLVIEAADLLNGPSDTPLAGTLAYMAPEQTLGISLTPAADWYAVGVMLYESLAGRLPYDGPVNEVVAAKQTGELPSRTSFARDAPQPLIDLCLDLLQRDPDRRPDGAEIHRRLGQGTAGIAGHHEEGRLVGRDTEVAIFRQAALDVQAGASVALYISGPSGMGKTALVRPLLREITTLPDAVVLMGACYEQEFVPYKAVDGVVEALARWLSARPEEELRELLPRDVAALARAFPALQRIARSAGTPPEETGGNLEMRRRAFSALRELLRRVADRHFLCVFIDDLQWGDLDSAALLRDVLHSPGSPRLLLLGSYRSEDESKSESLDALLAAPPAGSPLSVRHLRVGPLSHEDAVRVAASLLPGLPDAAEQAERIARDANGSPYLVLEMAAHAAASLGQLEMGAGLDDILWDRVRTLSEPAQRLLHAVAISGRPVRREILLEAAELSGSDRYLVSVLRNTNLVRTSGAGGQALIGPFHDRVRETVQSRLDEDRLRLCHARLAAVWEAAPDADPQDLAAHHHGAGNGEKAGIYYAQSAERSSAALAFDRASQQLKLALEVRTWDSTAKRKISEQLAQALANGGRNLEAAHEYEKLVPEAPAESAAELKRRIAYYYCTAGSREEGRSALGEVLQPLSTRLPSSAGAALLPLVISRTRLRLRGMEFRIRPDPPQALIARSDIFWTVGAGLAMIDLITASYFMTRCLHLSLDAGEPHRVARALAWEAALRVIQDEKSRCNGEQLLERCWGLLEEAPQPHAQGMYRLANGIRYASRSQFGKSVRELEEAARIFREECTGVAWELGTTQFWRLAMLSSLGSFPEMRVLSEQVLRDARDRGDRLTVSSVGALAEPYLLMFDDQPGAAGDALESALAGWHRDSPQQTMAIPIRGFIDIYAGRASEALARQQRDRWRNEWLLRILPQMSRVQMLYGMGVCQLAAADVSPDPRRLARAAIQVAARLSRDSDIPVARVFFNILMAGARASLDDREGAHEHLRSALGQAADLEMAATVHALRRRLGQLRGGDEGRDMVRAADEGIIELTIRNPERTSNTFQPGFARVV